MKKFLLLSTFIAALCCFCSIPAQAQDKNKDKDLAEVTFTVDIDCPNCQKKIEDTLPFEKGVKDMKVSLEERTVWVKYQTAKTSKDALIKALKKIGYTATEKTIKPVQ